MYRLWDEALVFEKVEKMQRMTLYVSAKERMLKQDFNEYLLDLFGGYTMVRSDGGWKDPDTGIVYEEYGYRYEVIAPAIQDEYCRWAAEKARSIFQQKCVLVTVEDVKGWFVDDETPNVT